MTNFYLFRHGQTDWNKENKIQGNTDISLNDMGQSEAQNLASKIQKEWKVDLEVIYSSDLSRAMQTASAVNKNYHVPLIPTQELRESCFGVAEGLTIDEIKKKFGQDSWTNFASSGEEKLDFKFKGGQSKRETRLRVESVLAHILKSTKYINVGISTHGAVLRHLIGTRLAPDHGPLQIPNCVLYKIVAPELDTTKWKVEGPFS